MTSVQLSKVLFNKQRYEFFSKSQHQNQKHQADQGCCSISKDTNFSANHNMWVRGRCQAVVLFNKQRYEFFSKSQPPRGRTPAPTWCCSISKDTNFSANHNICRKFQTAYRVLFNKQRYEFFSKSQQQKKHLISRNRCCSISKDTNFSANHNNLK